MRKSRSSASSYSSQTSTTEGRRTRNSSESSTLSYVEKLVHLTTCQFCSGILEEPRLLPCHHSFCTKCIQRMMHSVSDEFTCPVDRKLIKVPIYGINSFEEDIRATELDSIRRRLQADLSFLESQEQSDSSVAEIDVNLEWLSKGIKDVEHSSAIAQHNVHTIFEKVYKQLKRKEEELVKEIEEKCSHHLAYMEYEKFRLIEMKQSQNRLLMMPPNFHQGGNTDLANTSKQPNKAAESLKESSSHQSSLVCCDVGHQHIEFIPYESKVNELEKYLEDLGSISWEFGLSIKLQRDLDQLGEYPYGIDIIGSNKELLSPIMSAPTGISKGHGNKLLVAESEKNELIIVDSSFNIEKVIKGDGKFQSIADVACFQDKIYVADSVGCQVVLLNSDGDVIKTFGKHGTGSMELNGPCGLTVNSKGRIVVADSLNHRIQILSSNLQKCTKSLKGTGTKNVSSSSFIFPSGIDVDEDDNIYFCESKKNRVVMLAKDGKFVRAIQPADLREPSCVAVSSDQKILIGSEDNLMICDSKNGKELLRVSGITNSEGDLVKFKQIHGVVVDGTDKIMVTDAGYHSVLMF